MAPFNLDGRLGGPRRRSGREEGTGQVIGPKGRFSSAIALVDVGGVGLVQHEVRVAEQREALPGGVHDARRGRVAVSGKVGPHLHHEVAHVAVALMPAESAETLGHEVEFLVPGIVEEGEPEHKEKILHVRDESVCWEKSKKFFKDQKKNSKKNFLNRKKIFKKILKNLKKKIPKKFLNKFRKRYLTEKLPQGFKNNTVTKLFHAVNDRNDKKKNGKILKKEFLVRTWKYWKKIRNEV